MKFSKYLLKINELYLLSHSHVFPSSQRFTECGAFVCLFAGFRFPMRFQPFFFSSSVSLQLVTHPYFFLKIYTINSALWQMIEDEQITTTLLLTVYFLLWNLNDEHV